MKRILLGLSLLWPLAASAASPDGSIVFPPTLNSIPSVGTVTNGVYTNNGIAVLVGQNSTSGDYFAFMNGSNTNGGGRLLAVLNGGNLYAITVDGNWFQFAGGTTWNSVSAPVSTSGTTATSGGFVVNPEGVWSFGNDNLTGGKEVLLNGLPHNLAATSIEYLNGSIYAEDSNFNWSHWGGWETSANPNSYAVPSTITSSFLSSNFHSTFSDSFASGLPTICLNGTFSSTCNWYNGTEQCCMSPTAQPGNVGGAMYPTSVGPNGPYNPYSNDPSGGLDMTMHTETTTGLNPNYTSVFSGVTTSVASNGQGFLQQYGYFEATMWVSPNDGTWPAFWMLSPSKNMEIDVIEQYGHDPNHYWATNHDWGNGGIDGPASWPTAGQNLTTGYHQYGVLIDAGHTSFYLDRNLMVSYATRPDAKQPMYMLFDQGSGGGWPTCAGPMQVGVSPPPSGTSCGSGSAQLEGAVLKIQSINVWQHN